MTIFVTHAMESGLSSGWVRHWAWVQALPYHLEWKIMFVLILRPLQVESPIICPLLEKMDEHGLFVVENLWKKNRLPMNVFIRKYQQISFCENMSEKDSVYLWKSEHPVFWA